MGQKSEVPSASQLSQSARVRHLASASGIGQWHVAIVRRFLRCLRQGRRELSYIKAKSADAAGMNCFDGFAAVVRTHSDTFRDM